jgi:UDP-glucose 4-epimerase
MKVLVTGGAGFIGSHLIDSLLTRRDCEITVLDNFSQGRLENLQNCINDLRVHIVKADLTARSVLELEDLIPPDCNGVYHLAANPDVKTSFEEPAGHFRQNIVATFNLLEAVRQKHRGLDFFVFASTSAVYGDAEKIPTSEDYGPALPISMYGASKAACEAMISSYARVYNFRALILRFANVIGLRSSRGVIHDFIRKLERDATNLEILGDGTQTKSYLHVNDCISAINLALSDLRKRGRGAVSVLNVGSSDQINVRRIAELVCMEMHLKGVRFECKPATDDGRGWPGDVKNMRLDISKLRSLGWSPAMSSEQAVMKNARELLVHGKKEAPIQIPSRQTQRRNFLGRF